MTLFRKIVSLTNIYINENHRPYTSQICTVSKSESLKQKLATHRNILKSHGFSRFLLQRNVDQFNFIFFQWILFHANWHLKWALSRLKNNYEFLRFFFAANRISSETLKWWISQTSELSTWFLHFHGLKLSSSI